MEHEKIGVDLFNAIQNSSENQESIIKENDRKKFFYKPFKFQKENIEDLVGMLAKIQALLNRSYKDDHLLLEKKMLEAQDALIKECEKIYSERIRYNQQLQLLVQSTIVPYYHGRFQISLSREISLLPLELRLYIYTNLLAIEASTIRQMHLIDRIALTLHKSGETFLGDISIFISSWIKTKLSKVTFGTKKEFLSLYITEIESIQNAASLRERILNDAEMTPEIAGREFWYGLKGFSNPSSIHNYEVANICFDLFSNYFKGSFSIVEKLQPILKEAYKTKKFQEIDRCLEEEGLDEITISKRYIQATYTSDTFKEFSATEVEKIDEAQRSYANELAKGYKESSYLYINPSKEKVSDEQLRIPETLSPTKAMYYIDNLLHIISFKRILLCDFDEYIMKMSTSIISSEAWEAKKVNIVLGILAEIYGLVWLRNNQSKKDTLSLLKILLAILTKERLLDKYAQGKGWPIAIIIEETNRTQKRFSIINSSVSNFPSFVGLSYVGANPMDLKEEQVEDIVQSIAELQTHWQRIERKMHLPKSILRKRNNMWKKLREEQLKNISVFSNKVIVNDNNKHHKIGATYPVDSVGLKFSSSNSLDGEERELNELHDIDELGLEISDLTAANIKELAAICKVFNTKESARFNKAVFYKFETFDKNLLKKNRINEANHVSISLLEKEFIDKKYNIYRTLYSGFEKEILDYLILAIYLEESMFEAEKENGSYESIFKIYEHIILHELRWIVSKVKGWDSLKLLSIPELIKHLSKPDFHMLKESNAHFLEDVFIIYLLSNQMLGKHITIIEFQKMKEFCFGKLGLNTIAKAKLVLSKKDFPEVDVIEFSEFLQTEAGEEFARIFRNRTEI